MARKLIQVAVAIVAVAWLPILAAALLDPSGEYVGNALGLGLLAFFGTGLGIILLIVGILLRLFCRSPS